MANENLYPDMESFSSQDFTLPRVEPSHSAYQHIQMLTEVYAEISRIENEFSSNLPEKEKEQRIFDGLKSVVRLAYKYARQRLKGSYKQSAEALYTRSQSSLNYATDETGKFNSQANLRNIFESIKNHAVAAKSVLYNR